MPGPISRLGSSDLSNPLAMQHLADIANEGQFFSASGELEAMATPAGRALLQTRFGNFFDRKIARILPPAGFVTGTDARYRLMILNIMNSADSGSVPDTKDNLQFEHEFSPSYFPDGGDDGNTSGPLNPGNQLTAINLSEVTDFDVKSVNGTHLLSETGTLLVEVFCAYDTENPSTPHWFFVCPPPPIVWVVCGVDGGSNGSSTTTASYTYSITYAGVLLNTAQSPKIIRMKCLVTSADFGYAHIDISTKKYVLGYCNEFPQDEACS